MAPTTPEPGDSDVLEPGDGLPLQGGQTGAETEPNDCRQTALGPVQDDDSSPVGFSVRDVLADLRGQHEGTFLFADDVETPAVLDLQRGVGAAQYVRFEHTAIGDAGAMASEGECDGRLHIPLIARLRTSGAGASEPARSFDETFDLLLIANRADVASASLPLDGFGSLNAENLGLTPEQSISLLLLLDVSPRELLVEVGGSIHTQMSEQMSRDPNSVSLAAASLDAGRFRSELQRSE